MGGESGWNIWQRKQSRHKNWNRNAGISHSASQSGFERAAAENMDEENWREPARSERSEVVEEEDAEKIGLEKFIFYFVLQYTFLKLWNILKSNLREVQHQNLRLLIKINIQRTLHLIRPGGEKTIFDKAALATDIVNTHHAAAWGGGRMNHIVWWTLNSEQASCAGRRPSRHVKQANRM